MFSSSRIAASESAKPDHVAEVGAYFNQHVQSWINGPEIVAAIKAQNLETAGFDQAAIDAADKAWRAEVGSDTADRPMVEKVMQRDVSLYLKEKQRAADWMIVEIILMDAKGLNVGLSTPSSDYWQGDEAKYQKTYLVSPDALFIDDPEWNDETKTWRSQVNMTIADSESGSAIGAAVFEINLTELKRRLGS